MRAIIVEAPGTTPVLGAFPEPEPGGRLEVFDVVGAGVHWVARALAAGLHYGSQDDYPMIPGVDCVARAADGRLVYTGWAQPPWGTMAERVATPLGLDLPDGTDPLAIAAGMNPARSGWMPLIERRRELGSLGTVLVLGATGMSGRMAAQAAQHLGATRIVGAGRNEDQLAHLAARGIETVRLGDDATGDLTAALDGDAPCLVLDYVWGSVAEAAFAALGRSGLGDDDADITYVQSGSLAGPTAALPGSLLRSRRMRVIGSGAGATSTEAMVREAPRLMNLIADGTLEAPYVAYPFDRVADAWADTTGSHRAVMTP